MHFEKQGSTVISVSESADYRWMSIDDAVQTVLYKQQPQRPVLPHLSALLMALCYQTNPKNIVELGLGGGSLPRFFSHHFPKSKVASIENNPVVISLFQKWFSTNEKHHAVHNADANYKITEFTHLDLLFVDLFSNAGSPDFVSTLPFYQRCVEALSFDGVLTINLIAQFHLQFEMTLDLLKQLNLNIRTFSVPGYQNRIIIAARKELPMLQYNDDLNQFATNYGLDLNTIVAMS